MAASDTLLKAFRSQSYTDKQEFISSNLHYASGSAIVKHVGSYLLDVLDEVDDPELVASWLRNKNYIVLTPAE